MIYLKGFNESLENLPPDGGYLKLSSNEMKSFREHYKVVEYNTTTYAYAYSMFEEKWFKKINHEDIWLDIDLLSDNWIDVEIQIQSELMFFLCDGSDGLEKLCDDFAKFIPGKSITSEINENTTYSFPNTGNYTKLNPDQFVDFSDTYKRIHHYANNVYHPLIDIFFEKVVNELPTNSVLVKTPTMVKFKQRNHTVVSVDFYEDDWVVFNYYNFLLDSAINYYLCDGEDGIIKFSADWDKNKHDIK